MNSPPELIVFEKSIHWIGPDFAPIVLRALGPSVIPRLRLGVERTEGSFSHLEILKIYQEINRTYPDCIVYYTPEYQEALERGRRSMARSERRRR